MDLLESTCKIDKISGVKSPESKLERTYKVLAKKSMAEGSFVRRRVTLGGSAPEDKYLNKLGQAIGNMHEGYNFNAEEETEDSLMFEFTSSSAPTIRMFVDKKELKKYFSKE